MNTQEYKAKKAAYMRAWSKRPENRDKINAWSRKWAANNRERSREIKRAWRDKNPDAGRKYYAENRKRIRTEWNAYRFKYNLMRFYGLRPEDYDRMYRAQKGLCLICDDVPKGNGSRGRLHVDHDHTTGKVRGLLCWRCNVGMGNLNDDPKLLRAAAEYLERNRQGIMIP